ncbi:hypothetical protein GALMADRAFT_878054 [Galerina marginata CBS 339.88]|uniref:Uncharacterized protein n=1 Tax=Galerina marginata (strain CBS 339.88) TaxID=685588 RepID=A0A067SKK7_GALM3|nr:hypothetical protein GALMADRAFT_878054 [Galerina marginata CBS 339.88]
MFISKVFIFLFALLVSSAIAIPVRPNVGAVRQAAQAAKIVVKTKQSLRPASGQAVFWSGSRPGENGPVSVKQDAEHFAKVHGKGTLEQTLKGHGVIIPKNSPHRTKMWEVASKTYAQRAKGDTHVILGSTRRPDSHYDTIEKPALMKNKKVTRLTEHNAHTGKATVVK